MTEHIDARPALTSELCLGNGVTLPNRIAKAATSEHLATRHGAPTRQLTEVYRQLASTGAGLLISGNVMVDGSALEAHRNVVIEDERFLPALRDWAAATAGTDTKFILQLSHPGRQTMRGLSVAGRRQDVVSASAVPLAISGASRRMFTPPRALTEAEILALIDRFRTAARVAASAGFDGVELHAAHGYLFSQFLSPLVNQRQDRWGGSLENRMRLLLDTVRAVRAATPESFLLAVKLNSADFQRGGFDAEDALTVAKALQAEGVALIEVSGGTYENAAMISGTPKRASTAAREAYFLEFAERFARELTVPIMLSGGFRTRQGMIEALRGGAVDLIGLARPLAHEPDLAQRLLAGTADTSLVRRHAVGHRVVDDLIDGLWHQQQMARLGRGRPLRPERSAAVALAVVLLTGARDALLHRLPV
ncbi:NADH:flavin oxidoreductase/NADH oxidase family protein [Pseudonocardia sp. Cha107L01]|jgi:2,4-dienoyl-CoA reductase-like NADH-dependent reductase (Old Yellow Enzyme family)|uniref:NADH:flavin oxidoreductase/NADH oxidase family protein n=1 Tax=Pseudonocardia sp. Cha107L01 TaxID=3457576 RepID=UPI00403ED9D8